MEGRSLRSKALCQRGQEPKQHWGGVRVILHRARTVRRSSVAGAEWEGFQGKVESDLEWEEVGKTLILP